LPYPLEKIQANFDLGISLILFSWPNLTAAVQNEWGGPESSEKREWFVGAISDLFADRPDTDAADVEDVLIQVMMDEFEVNIEDDSEVSVAAAIMKLRTETLEGNFDTVNELRKEWDEKKNKKVKVQVVEEDGQEVSGSDFDEDSDEEMGDAPPLAPAKPKEKPVPEVDEDGFTKVVGKKR
jgi:pre-rRNA-processing protein TSR2